uniref:Probable magnesium transporter n=2 Tax=Lotus japonicus TaxID=34305 RepID=I3T160_LOTJA|nr:unknown [Lotus japonicus]
MALDNFNAAVVSPIYYALFTAFTILASLIMFKDYSGQSISSIVSELCGFITVLSGTTVLHSTREPDPPAITDLYTPLSPRVSWYIQGNGEPWKQKEEDVPPINLITIIRQDHFK